ncbi:hypothetical protein CEXT_785051 [Caerostris extrusa]|uniref:Uncharacterized protein n=1 Tax=Caerostris extrusa TaxID=172846 RepID=A0AAV4QGA3_CAEEX|nr:hypothetical protein CEXT_785051 [Caerostris extrusa]
MDGNEPFRERASTIGSPLQLKKPRKLKRLSTFHRRLNAQTLTDDYESATDEGDAHSPTGTSPTNFDKIIITKKKVVAELKLDLNKLTNEDI